MTSALSASPTPSTFRRVPLWAAIAAGGVVTSVALGTRSTFGLFLQPVVETIGTNRGTFALAIAIQQIVWGVCQPIAGAIADKFGTARVLAAGAVFFGAAMALMSTATSEAVLILSAGFLSGLAVATASFTVVLSAVGRMAPPEKRSMALGLVSAAGSIGQFVLIPLVRAILDRADWQTAAITLGVIGLTLLLFAPVLRGRSIDQVSAADRAAEGEARSLRDDLRRAGRSPHYLLLNAAFFVCGFHVTFIATHLPTYVDDLGLTERSGDVALMMIGLFNVFGSLAAGFLGGRFSKTRLLAGIYGMRAVAITAFLLISPSAATTVVFGAAMGLLWLSTVPLTSGIVTQQFGTANSGTLFGIVFLAHQLGAFAGAYMGGLIADETGSYELVWWIAIALGLMAMILHLILDDGPVPDEPALPRVGLAPAGGLATVVLVVGLASALALPARAAASDHDRSALTRLCAISG